MYHQPSTKNGVASYLLVLAILLNISACSLPRSTKPLADSITSTTTWNNFQQRAVAAAHDRASFRISASFKLVDNDETRLMQSLIWGNAPEDTDSRVRLDLRAGIGVVLAKISESHNDLLIFLPKENRAAHTKTPNLDKLGLPLPFSLFELSSLLLGREANVLAPGLVKEPPMASKALYISGDNIHGITYQLNKGPLKGRLLLSFDGFPIAWESDPASSGAYSTWSMSFRYSDQWDRGYMLKRLEINFPKVKKQIVLNIKERDVPEPYSVDQLILTLPDDVLPAHLDHNWLKGAEE